MDPSNTKSQTQSLVGEHQTTKDITLNVQTYFMLLGHKTHRKDTKKQLYGCCCCCCCCWNVPPSPQHSWSERYRNKRQVCWKVCGDLRSSSVFVWGGTLFPFLLTIAGDFNDVFWNGHPSTSLLRWNQCWQTISSYRISQMGRNIFPPQTFAVWPNHLLSILPPGKPAASIAPSKMMGGRSP